MKVLICGGRNYNDKQSVCDTLSRIQPDELIHGGCPTGADHWAEWWWLNVNSACMERAIYRAEWEKYGRRAGPLRNQRMLDECKPDLVLAFAGGNGTADMVRRARAANVPVVEVP